MKVTESQARKWLRALAWGAMKSQAIAREGAGSVRPETLESLGITNQKEADGIARSVDMTDKHNPLNPLTVANIFRRAEDHMPEAITIAYGQDTLAEVMAAWLQSGPHRSNILDRRMTSFGLGAAIVDGVIYWSLILAAPG